MVDHVIKLLEVVFFVLLEMRRCVLPHPEMTLLRDNNLTLPLLLGSALVSKGS